MDRRGFTSPPHPSYRPRRASRTAAPPAPSSCPRRAANRATTPPSLRWLRRRLLRPAEPSRCFLYRPFLSLSLSLSLSGVVGGDLGTGPEVEARFFFAFWTARERRKGTRAMDEKGGRSRTKTTAYISSLQLKITHLFVTIFILVHPSKYPVRYFT